MNKTISITRWLLALALLLGMAFAMSTTTVLADGHDGDCVIPESGPWPPCATGGDHGGQSTDDCVIPDSGPWPPCATGGNTPPPGQPADPDCVIPDSGPWPPCATGGNTAPPPADEEAAPDQDEVEPITFVTVFYVSDPDEIIGVFPVYEFNASWLVSGLQLNHDMLVIMRDSLGGALSGDEASCNVYEDAYEAIKESGIFFIDVPGQWQQLDAIYLTTFINALDRTRPAYLSCFDSGQVDQFNYGLALSSIYETLDVLVPTVEAAEALLGAPATPPPPPPAAEEPPADEPPAEEPPAEEPPTEEPEPEPEPAPPPPASAPRPPSDNPEPITFVTVYYESNPEEIIGVFPVVFFDADLLLERMEFNLQMLNQMSTSLNNGDCAGLEQGYEAIKEWTLFFVEIPAEYELSDSYYFASIIYTLDRTRPAYLSCFDSGSIDSFNQSLARLALDDVIPFLEEGIAVTKAVMGQ